MFLESILTAAINHLSTFQEKQRSFMSFGFSAETAAANAAAASQAGIRRESHVPSVNVTPTSHDLATGKFDMK